MRRYDAILFDLLTALLDSWTVWDRAAGSPQAGRRWRARYLQLTYGCGAYQPYERLVADAAEAVGLPRDLAGALEREWASLEPWPGVAMTLSRLRASYQLGVVTNCSERLGHIAAACVGLPFDVVITAERAGAYKPDPAPYRMALAELRREPNRVLFVAGSGYDLFGTAAVGLDTYWHNRVGLAAPDGAPQPLRQEATIEPLLDLLAANPRTPT